MGGSTVLCLFSTVVSHFHKPHLLFEQHTKGLIFSNANNQTRGTLLFKWHCEWQKFYNDA